MLKNFTHAFFPIQIFHISLYALCFPFTGHFSISLHLFNFQLISFLRLCLSSHAPHFIELILHDIYTHTHSTEIDRLNAILWRYRMAYQSGTTSFHPTDFLSNNLAFLLYFEAHDTHRDMRLNRSQHIPYSSFNLQSQQMGYFFRFFLCLYLASIFSCMASDTML